MATTALDIAPYRADAEVQEAETAVRTIADAARELQITDEATNAVALDLLSQARKGGKRIDALKRRWLDPLNAQLKLIRADFDTLAAPAREADQILSAKTSRYRQQALEAARKEEARLRALAEKRQERAAQKAEARGEEPPAAQPIVPTVAPPAKSVETQAGAKVTYRKVIRGEVVDAAAIPREWCCPDEKKLGAAARAGIITPESCPAGYRITITEEPVVR